MESGNILQNLRLFINSNSENKKQLLELLAKLSNTEHNDEIKKNNQCEFIDEFIEIITSSDTLNLSILCVTWIGQLIREKKLPQLTEHNLKTTMEWIRQMMITSVDGVTLNEIGIFMRNLDPNAVAFYLEYLFHPKNTGYLQTWQSNTADICEEDVFLFTKSFDTILNCLSEISLSTEQLDVIESVGAILISIHLSYKNNNLKSLQQAFFVERSLAILNKIVTLQPAYARANISELLGIAKMYTQYGIADKVGPPQRVFASQQSVCDLAKEGQETNCHYRNNGGKILKTRKPRAVVKAANQRLVSKSNHYNSYSERVIDSIGLFDVKTSDSDVSETDASSSNDSTPTRYHCSRIRLAALTLIGLVAKAQERRIQYGYWHALFPNSANVSPRDDLLFIATQDPNTRCRSFALQIAAQLILGSKDFLSQAEASTCRSPVAFVPFSISLGFMIEATYDVLISILSTEASLNVIIQALRCLAVLIQATSFHRLNIGIVSRFVKHIRTYMMHGDPIVQVSALMAIEFLIARPELTTEIYEVLGASKPSMLRETIQRNSFDSENNFLESEEYNNLSYEAENKVLFETKPSSSTKVKCYKITTWVLQYVLRNLNQTKHSYKPMANVRIECLQVIAAIVMHFSLVGEYLEDIAIALEQSLEDQLADIRLSTARCLDSCAYQIGKHLLETSANNQREVFLCNQFWLRMLPAIMRHIDSELNETAILKVSLCDALSNIGPIIFERFSSSQKMNLFSYLSSVASESSEDLAVRTAAVRTLAVYILFPSLRENLVFVENAAELMLRLVESSHLPVRIKVFWSIGNVSDALLVNNTERVSDHLLRRLVESATEACNDNDKVRCNAVRTLGNLLRLFSEQHFGIEKNREIFLRAIKKLIECISAVGNAKVKWNSCYAVGSLTHNRAIFAATRVYSDLNWAESMFVALCHVIVNHANFKVRINATAVITQIENRIYFGNHFELCWSSLLIAIEQSHNLHNFYEYNHRDNLQEQLCLAISHLLSCATSDDFVLLKPYLVEKLEIVHSTWIRVANRILPEKAAPLLATSERLRERISLAPDQKCVISFIAQVFAI